MRNLRSNIRTFTEPITIFVSKQEKVNGIVNSTKQSQHKTFGNVILNRDIGKFENSSNMDGDTINVTIRNMNIDFYPELTKIVVRGEEYVVVQVDNFGINTENITLVARSTNG